MMLFGKLMLCCFSFYSGDDDVKGDKELQAFVNELSAKGTGPDGGRGQVIKMVFLMERIHMTSRQRQLIDQLGSHIGEETAAILVYQAIPSGSFRN